MKKLFVFAMVLMAGFASAASIQWQLNTTVTKFDGSSIKDAGTAYVVFLGSDTLTGLSYADVIAKTQVGDSYTTSKTGKINKQAVPVDSETGLGNYAVYMTYVADGKTYYNVSTSVYSLTAANVNALLNEGTALPVSSFAFTDSKSTVNMASASATSGGWVAVPEPGTAAMALLGIGMLIRRRRKA